MSFLLLPRELQHVVCDLLPPQSLAALSLSCFHFHSIAQTHLYRHIHITPAFRNLTVVLTLAAKPHIARFVRSFSLSLASQSNAFLSYYHQLERALLHMTELSSLHLFVDPSASWLLRGMQAQRLTTFACSFPFDSYVASFLKTTPALLELEVDHASENCNNSDIQELMIPHLEQFRGSSQLAEAIVPGRPVHTIHLTSGDLTEEVVAHFADSKNNVSILGATIKSLPAPLLQSLSKLLPHLMYLRITTTYNFSDAPDVAFYEDVASALAAFPLLQAFELSGMHWGSLKNNENDMRIWQSEQIHSELHQPDAPSSFQTLDVDINSEFFTDY